MIRIFIFLLAVTRVSLALDFDPNAFGNGGDGEFQGKFCPPYRCPKGQEPVPKWPLGLKSTGCSGMGGQVVSANTGSSSKAETCCHERNACFQTCGMLKTHCEEQFLKCSEEKCAALDEKEKKACESTMSIHMLMAKFDQSCNRYDQEQYSHCECVDKDKAASKRERVIRSFYKKFNPDAVDKVQGLLKKVDTPSKMAGLLLKLVKKYPEAIKKVKDPQQEYLENLMGDMDEKKKEGGDGVNDEDEAVESDAEDLGVDEL